MNLVKDELEGFCAGREGMREENWQLREVTAKSSWTLHLGERERRDTSSVSN